RLRPGQGARHAFYREDADGPTITLPRRFRTKGVVLHELAHWALSPVGALPNHGRTFARLLLDATREFCGPARADMLATAFRVHGVRVAEPPRPGPDGRLRYGWDERLHLGRGKVLTVAHMPPGGVPTVSRARFEGYERGATLRFRTDDGTTLRIPTPSLLDV